MAGPVRSPKCALGIDVGGTKIYSLVIDSDNNILGRGKKKTGDGSPESLMSRMMASAGQALENASIDRESLLVAGIGFPGPLDPEQGIILQATNLPAWKNFPLAQEASQFLGCPVFVDNDVNLGTFGEAVLGAGMASKNVVGIFLGTGVGGGIVIDGKIYHGSFGTAGELGHFIIQYGGPKGPFGLQGSVEALTSRTAIFNQIKAEVKKGKKCKIDDLLKSGKRAGSAQLASAYREGDIVVRKALNRAAKFVGVTVGSLINLLAPDVVVIGGGLMTAIPEAILPIAKKVSYKIALSSHRDKCRVEAAALGDDAGAIGAALYARQRFTQPKA
jgi:glucokinase